MTEFPAWTNEAARRAAWWGAGRLYHAVTGWPTSDLSHPSVKKFVGEAEREARSRRYVDYMPPGGSAVARHIPGISSIRTFSGRRRFGGFRRTFRRSYRRPFRRTFRRFRRYRRY